MDQFIEQYGKIPAGQRYLALVALIAVVTAAYYTLFNVAQQNEIEELGVELSSQQGLQEEKRAFINNLAEYETRFNELRKELDRARTILPDTEKVPELLAELGNRARQSGLELEEFTPATEKESFGFYEEISFGMILRGSYHEIASFIDSISKMDRIVNVYQIKLTEPRTVNQKIILAGELTIKTYRFRSEEERANDDPSTTKTPSWNQMTTPLVLKNKK